MSQYDIQHEEPNQEDASQRRFFGLIRVSYTDLLDSIALLVDELLERSTIENACVFELPAFDDNDIGSPPEHIPIVLHQGDDALKLALRHIQSFKLDNEHSGRIIKRLPGLISLSHPEPVSVLSRMAIINHKKSELHKLIIQSHPDKNKRFLQLVDILPNLVKLKAFRDLLFANRPLYSVGFSWKHRKSMKRLSKRQLLDMLNKTLSYYESRFPLSPYNDIVQNELSLISQYPATSRFIMARNLRVAPAMNLRYEKDTDVILSELKAPVDMIAHSPLFVFNQSIKLHPLKPYCSQDARPPEAPRNRLVIDRLSIYEDSIDTS